VTAPSPKPRPAYVMPSLSRILLVIAVVLFVIASLCAGGVITGWSSLAFAFGALSAWALSGAVP
jgi:hypothetical protein